MSLVEATKSEAVVGRTLRQLAWARLRKDRVAVASMIVLTIIVLIAIFGPLISRWIGVNPYDFNTDLLSDAGSLPIGPFGGVSWDHPLGVEPLTGRDILARLLYGSRISLFIALSATVITVVVGTIVGIVAGYSRGRTDTVLSRFMDITLAFPLLLVIIAMSPVLEQRLQAWGLPAGNPSRITTLILVLSVFGWPYLARLIRGQVLSLREREFVEAAVSIGSSKRRILFRELLPNLWAPILVYATIAMPGLDWRRSRTCLPWYFSRATNTNLGLDAARVSWVFHSGSVLLLRATNHAFGGSSVIQSFGRRVTRCLRSKGGPKLSFSVSRELKKITTSTGGVKK
jgi:peptide/nickel transport system permease protein